MYYFISVLNIFMLLITLKKKKREKITQEFYKREFSFNLCKSYYIILFYFNYFLVKLI